MECVLYSNCRPSLNLRKLAYCASVLQLQEFSSRLESLEVDKEDEAKLGSTDDNAETVTVLKMESDVCYGTFWARKVTRIT